MPNMTEKERRHLLAGRENVHRKPLCSRNPLWLLCQRLFYFCVLLPVYGIFYRFGVGLKIENKSILRRMKKQGYVVVCNHIHVMDCTMAGLAAAPRMMYITSQEETFYIRGLRTLMRLLNGVPILKGPKGLQIFMDSMVKELKEGRIVLMYPEAEIEVLSDRLRPFHNGAFTMACRADVPVAPMVITPREAKGVWKLMRRKFCYLLTVGEPLYPDGKIESEKEAIGDLRDRTFAQMEVMLENGGHAYPDDDLDNPDAFWRVKKGKDL